MLKHVLGFQWSDRHEVIPLFADRYDVAKEVMERETGHARLLNAAEM
jgi:hypothetical protein